jgi:amidase
VAGETFLKSKDRTEVLTQCSATRLAEMIRARKVSSSEVVRAYIDRIEAVNPQLNAVVTKSYDLALKEAKEADEVLARGGACGPLHGVPMTIKDSLDTAGVRSTWGTLGRFNTIPARDATAVGRARAAGAILMGKTNTPEFTIGSGSYSIGTTMNLVFGLTRNPYDTRRSCAGSSGGAGSIVGAYGSGFDIGSDFGGSIRSPSHHNGVAGVKPTSGRVPRTGHAVDYGGIYDNQQQIGPMARRVEDLILITPIIAGPDDLGRRSEDPAGRVFLGRRGVPPTDAGDGVDGPRGGEGVGAGVPVGGGVRTRRLPRVLADVFEASVRGQQPVDSPVGGEGGDEVPGGGSEV